MVSRERAAEEFRRRFGVAPLAVAQAPGRVNLIGEHTDYHGGYVLPVAIDRNIAVAFSVAEGESHFRTMNRNDESTFEAKTCLPGEILGWPRYPAGVAWALRDRIAIKELSAFVVGDVPTGAGLSSSAAIEVACASAWNSLAEAPLEPKELALLCQKAENDFVGVPCGVMDQMAAACGQAGHALFLDCRDLSTRLIPVLDGISIVVCDTGLKHRHSGGSYAERRQESEDAAKVLGVELLRDATLEQVDAHRDRLGDMRYRRARHVVTENSRVLDFVLALEQGHHDQIFELMQASHISLRDDYEVSCPELDAMAESAWSAPGCVGARMTGGGFGGACVALVEKECLREFQDWVDGDYRRATGRSANFLVCKAADGASVEMVQPSD